MSWRPCATDSLSLRDSALPGVSGPQGARLLWTKRRKLMRSPLAAPLGALFLLAACSGQAQTEDKPAQTETTTDESTLPDTGGGEPIELTAIGKGELLRLDGDHECGFTIEGQSGRSEEHTSELQSLMRKSYAVFCLKKK